MKKYLLPLVAVATFVFCSCSSPKKIAYLQHAEDYNYDATRYQYNIRVMPKDNLSILVTGTDYESVRPFNKYSSMGTNGIIGVGNSQTALYTYAVDDDGTINYPVLGRIKLEGLTRRECEEFIAEKIKPYMAEGENPIVTVRFNSFHFTVLGEVGGPGIKVSPYEKCSILDALAMSGDIGILGKRDNIMLVREDASGQKSIHRLSVLDPNVMKSPYFYLQQGDLIYVEPNSIKKTNASIGTSTSLWLSLAGVLVSSATLVTNILK